MHKVIVAYEQVQAEVYSKRFQQCVSPMFSIYCDAEHEAAKGAGNRLKNGIQRSLSKDAYSLPPFPSWARALPTGDGPDDDERLLPGCDGVGERGVERFVGEILFAGEEA
jgi:hypothetical protein